MKIGIDVDECLINLVDNFLDFNREKYKIDVKREDVFCYDFWEIFKIPKKEAYRRMDEFFNSKFFERVSPVDGAKKAIYELSKNRENKLYVITSRPIHIKNKTKEQLEGFFGEVFYDISHTDEYSDFERQISEVNRKTKKVRVCQDRKIDVLIEDSLKNALECAEGVEGIEILLMNQPWNKNGNLPSNVYRVYSWEEILIKIKEIKNEF
ncbi:MAG: hypothetical protein AABX30_01885 [Nanoarchaeota archaeon]